MKLTAVELRVKEDTSFDVKEGETHVYLQGEDSEWYDLLPGKTIEVSDEDIQVRAATEDSILERIE